MIKPLLLWALAACLLLAAPPAQAEDTPPAEKSSPILARFEEELLAQRFLDELVHKHLGSDQPALTSTAALKRLPPITMSDLHRKGLELTSERRYAEAARIYEEIIIADANDDEAYIILGHLYLLSGRYADAENAFWNAVEIDPSTREDIIPFYENLILQSPDDDTALSQLGYALLIMGDVSRAEASFRDALEINPLNEEARRGLGVIDRSFG